MSEDRHLLGKLKVGEKEALRQLYEKYKDELLTVAIGLMGNASAAEDVLHDVFVSFADTCLTLRLRRSLKGYLITCVVNRCRDRFRQKLAKTVRLDDTSEISAGCAGPVQEVCNCEQSQRLSEALGQLPYEQREVIVLHLQAGMTFREIARQQRHSMNTVQSRYRYGLKRLRSLLSDTD